MLALAVALSSIAPTLAERTLVIVNLDSPTSIAIGEDYMAKRGVKQRLNVKCQDSSQSAGAETMLYGDFHDRIEQPLKQYLTKHPAIDFVVTNKGIPIRLTGVPGFGLANNQPSLDSTIAALGYDADSKAAKVAISDSGFTGTAWANNFWNSKERFSHAKFGGYLVTRLDGYTEDEAKMLVRWAMQSELKRPTGPVLLDICPSFGLTDPATEPVPIFSEKPDPKSGGKSVNELDYKHYNGDMALAGQLLTKAGVPVTAETTDLFATGQDLMGYVSWGSNDSHFDAANYGKLRFAPGAIAETAVSTSARTFLKTSGGQSHIADLVSARVTGVKGYCDEPLLQAVASPSILFDRYARGWTLAESFYAASRFIAWEDIVVGDPLCSPYKPVKRR